MNNEGTNNKKIIYTVIAVLILLASWIAYKAFVPKTYSGTDTPATTMVENKNEQPTTQEMTIKGTLESLLARGAVMKCTYSMDIENNVTSGTTYVSGKKMRGDFTVNINNTMMQSHMISDGTTLYTWTDQMPQGMKMMMPTTNDQNPTDKQPEQQPDTTINLQQEYDYSCSPWIEDASIFAVPTDIEFVDLSEQTNKMMQNTNSMCAACDYIEDAGAKSECKTQFSCE